MDTQFPPNSYSLLIIDRYIDASFSTSTHDDKYHQSIIISREAWILNLDPLLLYNIVQLVSYIGFAKENLSLIAVKYIFAKRQELVS